MSNPSPCWLTPTLGASPLGRGDVLRCLELARTVSYKRCELVMQRDVVELS